MTTLKIKFELFSKLLLVLTLIFSGLLVFLICNIGTFSLNILNHVYTLDSIFSVIVLFSIIFFNILFAYILLFVLSILLFMFLNKIFSHISPNNSSAVTKAKYVFFSNFSISMIYILYNILSFLYNLSSNVY